MLAAYCRQLFHNSTNNLQKNTVSRRKTFHRFLLPVTRGMNYFEKNTVFSSFYFEVSVISEAKCGFTKTQRGKWHSMVHFVTVPV